MKEGISDVALEHELATLPHRWTRTQSNTWTIAGNKERLDRLEKKVDIILAMLLDDKKQEEAP